MDTAITGLGNGVISGNGYTVVSGNVYRHPGRSVSVNGGQVRDSRTGEVLQSSGTVPSGGGQQIVQTADGLWINGVRIV